MYIYTYIYIYLYTVKSRVQADPVYKPRAVFGSKNWDKIFPTIHGDVIGDSAVESRFTEISYTGVY